MCTETKLLWAHQEPQIEPTHPPVSVPRWLHGSALYFKRSGFTFFIFSQLTSDRLLLQFRRARIALMNHLNRLFSSVDQNKQTNRWTDRHIHCVQVFVYVRECATVSTSSNKRPDLLKCRTKETVGFSPVENKHSFIGIVRWTRKTWRQITRDRHWK